MIFGLFKSGIKNEEGQDYMSVGTENGLELSPLATFIRDIFCDEEDDSKDEE